MAGNRLLEDPVLRSHVQRGEYWRVRASDVGLVSTEEFQLLSLRERLLLLETLGRMYREAEAVINSGEPSGMSE